MLSASVLAACGGGGETTADRPAGPTVLDFEAATVAGGQLAGEDLVGQDLALWFWAPW